MKIIKNIPIPKSYSRFEHLLEMEVGDCVELNKRQDLNSVGNFLRKHFKIKRKQISWDGKHFIGRIWRIK